jgi:hypothetical protein
VAVELTLDLRVVGGVVEAELDTDWARLAELLERSDESGRPQDRVLVRRFLDDALNDRHPAAAPGCSAKERGITCGVPDHWPSWPRSGLQIASTGWSSTATG